MEFSAEVDVLLLNRFLEQHFVCVAVRAVEGIDASGGGESFCLPEAFTAHGVSTTLPFASGRYPYWRQRFLIRGNCTVSPPFSLRVT